MGREWVHDKNWADQYWLRVEAIIRSVAGLIVSVSPTEVEEDWAGRDYRVEGGAMAAHLRRPGVRYRDLTIRSWRKSGAETELQKWSRGAADWLLYGWTDEETVPEWVVVDLGGLFARELHVGRKETPNIDGRSAFITVPLEEIIARGLLIDGVVKIPTQVTRHGKIYPVVRCPKCNSVSSTPAPDGLPRRQCRWCGWTWTPPLDPQDPGFQAAMRDPQIRAALEKLDARIVDISPREADSDEDEPHTTE